MTMKTATASTPILSPQRQKRASRSSKKSQSGVRKSSTEKRERQQTLEKLRQMVGSDENSSQLEIVQVRNFQERLYLEKR